MKPIIVVACATIFLYACNTSKQISFATTKQSFDQSGKPMLLGERSRAELEKDSFAVWFFQHYNSYTINDTVVNLLRPALEGKSMTIFLGTWCGDSKREVPRMLKLLDSLSISSSEIHLIMLDDADSVYKQSPAHEEKGLNIHRVPTFIVYDGKKELGRIVESPSESLEADLLSIVTGSPYQQKYRGVVYLDSVIRRERITKIERNINQHLHSARTLVRNAGELNTYGYVLMAARKFRETGFVFRLNTELYPANPNVFDSLGEFYFKTGDFSLAEDNYRKVLKLDPGNENAMKMLEKLQLFQHRQNK